MSVCKVGLMLPADVFGERLFSLSAFAFSRSSDDLLAVVLDDPLGLPTVALSEPQARGLELSWHSFAISLMSRRVTKSLRPMRAILNRPAFACARRHFAFMPPRGKAMRRASASVSNAVSLTVGGWMLTTDKREAPAWQEGFSACGVRYDMQGGAIGPNGFTGSSDVK